MVVKLKSFKIQSRQAIYGLTEGGSGWSLNKDDILKANCGRIELGVNKEDFQEKPESFYEKVNLDCFKSYDVREK